MCRSSFFATSAAVAAFALVSVQAQAQHRGGGARGGGSSGVRMAAPRAAAPRAFSSGTRMAPRMGTARMVAPRFGASSVRSSARVVGVRPVGGVVRPAFGSRAVVVSRGFPVAHGFSPHVVGARVFVSPVRFARPFYAFRPRFSIGFGLWAGFPVAYPYYGYPYYYGGYPYPYPYAAAPYAGYPPYGYPYADSYGAPGAAYGYPNAAYPQQAYPQQPYPPQQYPQSSVGAQRVPDSGGVSFEITPSTARVFVDGTEVGTVAEFSPTSTPLTLTLGRHHIEIRAAGRQTMAFDADIVAGQVIPYRGDMQVLR
jgi:hypothetical protein